MKTPSGWAKKGRIVSVVGAVFALAFLTVVRYSGASAGANGERLGFVPASHASGLNQTHRERPMTKAYSGLPISFEQNVGQSASEVSYLSRGSGFELFLPSEEAVLALRNPVPHDLSPRHRFATLRALREARQIMRDWIPKGQNCLFRR